MSERPSNVIEALVAVSRDVDAIAKEKTANAGGTFKYRGIEDVLSACHDPFIRYGVVVVPQVTKAEMIKHEVTRSSGKVGYDFEAQMTVNYRIYGPGGPSDFIDAPIFATGMDSSDKGTGKAMSYAYKQLMFQLLCIPTDAAEDNEATHRTMDRQPVPEDFYGWPNQAEHDAWWKVQSGRLKALNDAAREAAIGKLIENGQFAVRDGKRVPILPFDVTMRVDVEAIINGAERLTAPLVAHSQHAIDIMADALNCDPLDHSTMGPAIEPWMWDLAEVEDLDAHDWKTTARAAKVRQADLVDRAFHVAERLGLPTPDGLNDIHGPVAAELRVSLLKGETF